ncbi:MAG: antibiotic biosynthesis monooxygenase [Dysgonamonadaceae bacterium]|jgi:quinol monooxygenase YgiN|nr:antibiotic biosynthesis monooxygenase [Dysgonamonadaceae bacterium]
MKTILKSGFLLSAICLTLSFTAACTSPSSTKESAQAKKAELLIVAHITTTAEYQTDIEKTFQAVVAGTRQEEGCVSYILYQHNDNPLKYTFVEEWVSQAAIDAHHNSAHYKAFTAATAGKIEVEAYVMKKKY